MPEVSFYYSSVSNLVLPVLLWGILMAVIQFTKEPSDLENSGQGIIIKIIAGCKLVWITLFVLLTGYILFKLGMTSTGWLGSKWFDFIPATLLGKSVPTIEDIVGLGSSIVLVVLIVCGIDQLIKRMLDSGE